MLNNKIPSKIKTLFSITVFSFVLGASLLGCASNDDTKESRWTSTDEIYSSKAILNSQAMVSDNGNVIFIWQEQLTEVRDDTAKDAAHTFSGTSSLVDSHASLHAHKLLYSKTVVKAKLYDASTESWGGERELTTGYWEKIKSGSLDTANAGDNSKIVYDENINNIFVGDSAVAMNSKGDAVLAWVQLNESTTVSGDAGLGHTLFVSRYKASTKTWSAPSAISTGTVSVQNDIAVDLNDDSISHLVWLGREINGNTIDAYSNSYDGSTWATAEVISDGVSTVRDIQLIQRTQASGVAVWLQDNVAAQGGNQTQQNLYANWYNITNAATSWNATPALVSNGLGEVKDFTVAKNASGKLWVSWSQTNGDYLVSGGYDADDVTTIWVNDFNGDIDSDLTLGTWQDTGAKNIQATSETNLAAQDVSVAVDVSGNVLVTWVENGNGLTLPSARKDAIIRANLYTVSTAENTAGKWLSESFVVSDTGVFEPNQPIEKTIPNDHVAPKVVATAQNKFTISWAYWSTSRDLSGYKLYSVDYNASSKTMAKVSSVSQGAGVVVDQLVTYTVDGDVQMLWSQETDAGVSLRKSVK